MEGWPVWLASLSLQHRKKGALPTTRWSKRDRARAELNLRNVLFDAGDSSRERVFRMNATLCMHRALSDEEYKGLASWWQDSPSVGMAGGVLEILSETVGATPSAQPCVQPGHLQIPGTEKAKYASELWAPVDCGACEPCLARARGQALEVARMDMLQT